jgi:hypothetical protein
MTPYALAPIRAQRRAHRGTHLAAHAVELVGAQLAGRAARIQPRAPEDLVGQQVAHAGHDGLVHEPRLQRGSPAAHACAELVAPDLGGVGSQGGEVGLQACPAQPALVAQRQRPAVLEVHDEAVPAARRRLLVDRDAPGHSEVQAEHRPVARGLDPHRLAPAVRGGQLAADERVGDLAGRVRAAHVGVAVVDPDDAPEKGAALDRRPGTLSLR